MTLQQLRYLREVVRLGCNVTRAAESLDMSQPGLSRQIQLLESEVGVDLFVRNHKRFVELSEPGRKVYEIATRMLRDAEALCGVGAEYRGESTGTLTIATTHTQARYALPTVVQEFSQKYPDVTLRLRQGTPSEVWQMVIDGTADLCIATAPVEPEPELAFLPVYELPRVVLTPVGHPLMRDKTLTLTKLARYPLITYDYAFVSRSRIVEAFSRQKIVPSIVLNAIDADVIKTYVEQGMGVAILPALAYNRRRDTGLRARDASALFEPSIIQIGIRRNNYLRGYAYAFIELFAPQFGRDAVRRAVQGDDKRPLAPTEKRRGDDLQG
jgi:LysR family cys regulon transcriptional activator